MSALLAPMRPAGTAPGWPDRLDPRVRLVVALVYAVVVVALHSLPVLALALAVSLCGLLGARLPVGPILRRVAAMDGFILFMLALLPFTVPGRPLFAIGGVQASIEGGMQAVEIGLTANAVVMALLVLVGTMEPVRMGHAMHALRVPEKLVLMLLFTIRYVEVLRDEYLRLRTAMKMRGFQAGTNWHSYRSLGYLVGMLLVRAMERSERIFEAMKCRGFSGRFLLLEDFALRGGDLRFMALAGAVCATLIGLEVAWN